MIILLYSVQADAAFILPPQSQFHQDIGGVEMRAAASTDAEVETGGQAIGVARVLEVRGAGGGVGVR